MAYNRVITVNGHTFYIRFNYSKWTYEWGVYINGRFNMYGCGDTESECEKDIKTEYGGD